MDGMEKLSDISKSEVCNLQSKHTGKKSYSLQMGAPLTEKTTKPTKQPPKKTHILLTE